MNRVDLSMVKNDLYKLPFFIVSKLYRWAESVENDGIEEVNKHDY